MRWRIKSPASRLTVYSGADQRKHQAPSHWPMWGEFTGDRWVPRRKDNNAENVSIWCRHHVFCVSWLGKSEFWKWTFNLHVCTEITYGCVSASLVGSSPEFFWAGKLHSADSGLRWITSGWVHTDDALIKISSIVRNRIWCGRPLCLHGFGRYLDISIRYSSTGYPSLINRFWVINIMVSNESWCDSILFDINVFSDTMI